jgi:hypothetical protein
LYIIYDYFFPAYKAGGPIQSLMNLASYISSKVPTRIVCNNCDLGGEKLNVSCDRWIDHAGSHVFYSSKGFDQYSKVLNHPGAVAFINGIYSIQYNLLPAIFFKGRKIISVRGMLHSDAISQKRFKKTLYLAFWKFLSLHRKCEYHATTEAEKKEIIKVFGKRTKVWVVSNLSNFLIIVCLPRKRMNLSSLLWH